MTQMSHLSHTALVGDQCLNESETESLKHSMKYHMKYGSTGSDHKSINRYKYMTHTVQPTDTLQGLALRFEVTVEQIKKANNLWSNDNLWLRSRTHISIPVLLPETTIESPLYSLSDSNSSSQTTSPKALQQLKNGSHRSSTTTADNNSSLESVDISVDRRESSSSSRLESHKMSLDSKLKLKNGFKMAPQLVSNDGRTHDMDSYESNDVIDESAADFLIRIDSSIAKSKDKMKDMQQNRLTGTHSDDDLFRLNNTSSQRSALRRHHSSASRPHSANSSANQIHDFPQPLVMMTHKRKVKSSLKRLERTQDEIFEL